MTLRNDGDLWAFSEAIMECRTAREIKARLPGLTAGKCPCFLVNGWSLVGVRLSEGVNPTHLALNMLTLRRIARRRLHICNPTLDNEQVYNLTMYGYGFTQVYNRETEEVEVYYLPKEKDQGKRCVKKKLLWTASIGVAEGWKTVSPEVLRRATAKENNQKTVEGARRW